MSDFLYEGLTISVRQVKDESIETDRQGNRFSQELPGFIEFGVILDGHFETIFRRKAPGLLSDIKRSKDSGYEAPPQSQSEPGVTGDQLASVESRVAALEQAHAESQTGQNEPPPSGEPSLEG